MRPYDPARIVIGLHIPKCAGSSMKRILREWFGHQMHWHYFDELNNRGPTRYRATPLHRALRHLTGYNTCIYGHFNRARGFGVESYYPEATQYFTVVRDPLNTTLSRYFAAKSLGERRMRAGTPTPISAQYPSLNDFVADQIDQPYFANYLPGPMTLENYTEILARHFVYIGIAEDLQTSVDHLAARLGFASIMAPHINQSIHDEQLSPEIKEAFVTARPLEYAIYKYAVEHYRE